MNRSKSRLAFSALLVVAAVAWLSATRYALAGPANTFQETLPLRPGGALTLTNINGSVYITGWNQPKIEVRAVKTALQNPADLDRVSIHAQSDGGNATVSTEYPRGKGVEVTVEFHIRVPERILLRSVQTVNGNVRVEGITGAGHLGSVNGSVEVLDSEGRFSARSTNGDVREELRSLPDGQPIQLTTVNGSVILSLPQGVGAELSISSRNGNFHSDFPLQTLGAYSAKLFQGQLGAGGGRILLGTVNGAIRLVRSRAVI